MVQSGAGREARGVTERKLFPKWNLPWNPRISYTLSLDYNLSPSVFCMDGEVWSRLCLVFFGRSGFLFHSILKQNCIYKCIPRGIELVRLYTQREEDLWWEGSAIAHWMKLSQGSFARYLSSKISKWTQSTPVSAKRKAPLDRNCSENIPNFLFSASRGCVQPEPSLASWVIIERENNWTFIVWAVMCPQSLWVCAAPCPWRGSVPTLLGPLCFFKVFLAPLLHLVSTCATTTGPPLGAPFHLTACMFSV